MASYFCLSWNPFSIQNPLKNISLTNIISLPTLQVHSTYNFLPYYALFLAYIHYLSSWAKCKLYTRQDCFVFFLLLLLSFDSHHLKKDQMHNKY